MQMHKHVLPVIDEALLRPEALRDTVVSRSSLEGLALRARRFVFDQAASEYLGRFIRDSGDLVIEQRQFAIAPCEPTYIEYDSTALFAGMGIEPGRGLDDGPGFFSTDTDHQVGALIYGRSVQEFIRSVRGNVKISMLRVDRDTPREVDLPLSPVRYMDDLYRLALILGTSVHDFTSEDDRQDILDNNRLVLNLDARAREVLLKKGAHRLLSGMNGFLRTVWAALLLINQKRGISFGDAPRRSVISRGKRRVYAAHSVVKLDLCPRDEMRRRALSGRRESPRRHEVRGHFVHRGLTEGCVHVWPAEPTEIIEREGRLIPRWRCGNCGGLRSWRAEMVRGDGEKGFTTHTYAVVDSSSRSQITPR